MCVPAVLVGLDGGSADCRTVRTLNNYPIKGGSSGGRSKRREPLANKAPNLTLKRGVKPFCFLLQVPPV